MLLGVNTLLTCLQHEKRAFVNAISAFHPCRKQGLGEKPVGKTDIT